MKTSLKLKKEIVEAFLNAGFTEKDANSYILNCSKSIFEAIGIQGLLECCEKDDFDNSCSKNGGVPYHYFSIEKETEKAYLLSYRGKNKWIAKSIIKSISGTTLVPSWAWNN